MRNIKLIIEYDGSRYDGWQRSVINTKGTSIKEKIENVLQQMEEEPIELIGAARTEAGVHAYGQTANFHTNTRKKMYEIEQYLNRYLPRDIAVLLAEEVDERFHSGYLAKSYRYEYKITMGEVPSVFDRKYNYYCFKPLDLEKMKEASRYFIGNHDFKTFSENKRMKKSTDRIIYGIDIYGDKKEASITIQGDDFWPNMVRILVGTLMDVGHGLKRPEDMAAILRSGDRSLAGATADPKGLFLVDIEYELS